MDRWSKQIDMPTSPYALPAEISPQELACWMMEPGIPEELDLIFKEKPFFILDLKHFLFVSEIKDSLECEVERLRVDQFQVYERMVLAGIEPMLKVPLERNC